MTQESEHIPIVIIGGGIIGLCTAYELIQKNIFDFCILEKESYLGEHTSGRNSGVIHAGLYYPKDSLKKKFCINAFERWNKFCSDHELFFKKCGKYIFAPEKYNRELIELHDNAKNNGANVRMASKSEILELNEYCNTYNAFYSPNTSIIDSSEIINFLKNYVEKKNIPIMKLHEVTQICKLENNTNKNFNVNFHDQNITCSYIINAAGHGAVKLRKALGLTDVESLKVKGHYIKTNKSFYNKSLLYPLPEENLKGLGIHTCIDSDGSVRFGPDTLDVDEMNYINNPINIEKMKFTITSQFKIHENSLHADFCGIRPKIKIENNLYNDFWIKSPIKNYIEFLGIESPGFTCAFDIAREGIKFLE